MGNESIYQVRILSNPINKQINKWRSYTSIATQPTIKLAQQMDPWFLTGLVDAEGCFIIGISRNSKSKIGWGVKLV